MDRTRWRGWLRRGSLPLLLAAATLSDLLFPWRTPGRLFASLAGLAVVALLFARTLQTARQLRRAVRVQSIFRTRIAEILLTFGAAALLLTKVLLWTAVAPGAAPESALERVYQQYAVAFLVIASLRLALAQMHLRHLLQRLELAPAQTVAAGFALTILGGGLVLGLPMSVTSIESLDILDALFTATSAVTVTGLAVYEPASHRTWFGQLVLLLLIQVGGIGTVVAGSLLLLAGRRMQLKQATALQEAMDVDTVGHVRTMVLTALGVTAAVEAVGALLLALSWRDLPDAPGPFVAVFHSVSAFCNAGFSNFAGNNLLHLVDRPAANAVLAALIVLGGLDFLCCACWGSACGPGAAAAVSRCPCTPGWP